MRTKSFSCITEDVSKRMQLIGRTISPVIVKNRIFYIKGCKVTIAKKQDLNNEEHSTYPKKIHLGKLIKGERKKPSWRLLIIASPLPPLPNRVIAFFSGMTRPICSPSRICRPATDWFTRDSKSWLTKFAEDGVFC